MGAFRAPFRGRATGARAKEVSAGPTPDRDGAAAAGGRNGVSEGTEPSQGLCARCRWARRVRTPRSEFWLCMRSRDDSRYPRYPRLPVLECGGFTALAPGEAVPEGPPPREQG